VLAGTAPATWSGYTAGTGNFTAVARVRVPAFAANQSIVGGDSLAFGFRVTTAAKLQSTLSGSADNTESSGTLEANKDAIVAYVREGTTGTYYINGVAVGTTTDSRNYSAASTWIGGTGAAGTTTPLTGRCDILGIENRALSAAEILRIAETGALPAEDYGTPGSVAPSNTNLVGDAFSNYQYDSGTIVSGATSNAFSAVESGGQVCQATTRKATGTFLGIAPAGSKFLVTFSATLTSGAVPVVYVDKSGTGGASNNHVVTSGDNSVVFTLTNALTTEVSNGCGGIAFSTTGNTSYSVSGLKVSRIGLVLALETNAPGNGYQLKDMSGNKNDITLPVSGFSWALPDRRPNSVRRTFTWAAANDPKAMLSSEHPLPVGAVVRDIVVQSTAATSGTGMKVGNAAGSSTYWVTSVALTTAKKICSLANRFGTGTYENRNFYFIPDSVAFTGSISAEIVYDLTEGQ
jgi:hypothetical protein